MVNPENTRLIADERAALEAETVLAREEQKLWQRLEATLADALDKRTQGLAGRIAQLEQAGAANPDLQKAKAITQAGAGPDPVVAQGERAAALSARKGALQAREAAVKALQGAVGALEGLKAGRAKELDQAEQLLGQFESSQKKAAEQKKKDEAEAAKKAQEAAKKADDDRRAAEKAAAKAAAAFEETKTVPEMAPIAIPASAQKTDQAKVELKTEPGFRVDAVDLTKTDPGVPPVKAAGKSEPSKAPVGTAPSLAKVPATATPADGVKKVSKRRRVKLAPPPKRLEVDVAVYGENNFYTGFDQTISTGGLFVQSLETLPAGHELEIEIHLEERRIATRGRVEWTRVDNLANPECTQGAGVKLLNLTRDNATVIESFFQKRQPLFYAAS